MKTNDWYNAYFTLAENKGDVQILNNMKELVKQVWTLFANVVNQIVFDQYADEDGVELFSIESKNGTPVRHYLKDDTTLPLFRDDIYDLLIVGMAQKVVEDYSICDDLLAEGDGTRKHKQ